MNRRRTGAFRGLPRHRAGEGPIQLESTHTVTIPPQTFSIRRRQLLSGDFKQLARSQIAENHSRRWQLVQRLHACARNDFTTEGGQVGGQRIAQLLCSASYDRPANRVSCNSQDQTEGGRAPMLERQHRVSRHTGKKSFGSFSLKATFSQAARGLDTEQAESCQAPWMPRWAYGTQADRRPSHSNSRPMAP